MNPKLVFVAIAIVAAFGIAAVVGLATVTPVLAQDNMTAGKAMVLSNQTGGNMTGGGMLANMTGGG
jgi:type IV secretory pathway component VirB8